MKNICNRFLILDQTNKKYKLYFQIFNNLIKDLNYIKYLSLLRQLYINFNLYIIGENIFIFIQYTIFETEYIKIISKNK